VELDISKGWLPDLKPTEIAGVGGLYTAKNILPGVGGYRSINGLKAFLPNIIADTPYNAISIEGSDLIRRNFLFAGKKAYKFSKNGITEFPIFTSEPDYVSAISYGDYLIATNYSDPIMYLDLVNEQAGFQQLSTEAPQCKYLLFFKGHLIAANIYEGSTPYPKRIRWSARENIFNWAENLTTGADFQDFPDIEGEINGIAQYGNKIAIFTEKSITLGEYSGGIYTYFFYPNAIKNIGLYYPKSLVSLGDAIYFCASDGIYRLSDSGLQDISVGRVKETAIRMADSSNPLSVKGIYDRENKLIFWSIRPVSSPNYYYILVYSPIYDIFTLVELEHKYLMSGFSEPQSIDDLSSQLIDAEYIKIDQLKTISEQEELMALDKDGYFASFTGDKLFAEIETGDYSSFPNILTCRNLFVIFEGDYEGVVVGKHRYYSTEQKKSSSISPINRKGEAHMLMSNRFLSFKLAITFEKISSKLMADITTRGMR